MGNLKSKPQTMSEQLGCRGKLSVSASISALGTPCARILKGADKRIFNVPRILSRACVGDVLRGIPEGWRARTLRILSFSELLRQLKVSSCTGNAGAGRMACGSPE